MQALHLLPILDDPLLGPIHKRMLGYIVIPVDVSIKRCLSMNKWMRLLDAGDDIELLA